MRQEGRRRQEDPDWVTLLLRLSRSHPGVGSLLFSSCFSVTFAWVSVQFHARGWK